MISYLVAQEIIKDIAGKRSAQVLSRTESIPLLCCVGRIVAKDIVSPIDSPSFTNSAMDGFAVRAKDTATASESNPLVFRVKAEIAAGDTENSIDRSSGKLSAVAISTGAMVPEGLDAVVKIEDVVVKDSTTFLVNEPIRPFENVRIKAEDITIGECIVPKCTRLCLEHIGVLASIGIAEVEVLRKPRVGIISTGKELIPIGEPLRNGKIYNSSAPFLLATLNYLGADTTFCAIVADDPDQMEELLRRSDYDCLISTGAVSVGKHDFVRASLEKTNAKVQFHKVAIRPGKPMMFADWGRADRPVFFGLPGNAVSTMVGYRFFVRPFLELMLQQQLEQPMVAVLSYPVEKPYGLRCFFRGQWDKQSNQVTVLPNQSSSKMKPLVESNVWVTLLEDTQCVEKGTLVEIYALT